MCKGKLYVPNSGKLKNIVLREMHNVPYARHCGYQKTLETIRIQYFWPRMNK
jgi:hypothetical protein